MHEKTSQKDYLRVNEGTIRIRNADCLLDQIRFICSCHGCKGT